MADNYLENQYEKYLARKAAWEKSKKRTVKRTKTATGQKEETQTSPSTTQEPQP